MIYKSKINKKCTHFCHNSLNPDVKIYVLMKSASNLLVFPLPIMPVVCDYYRITVSCTEIKFGTNENVPQGWSVPVTGQKLMADSYEYMCIYPYSKLWQNELICCLCCICL